MGRFTYDNDISLLYPKLTDIEKMLDICENYNTINVNYNILFLNIILSINYNFLI